MQCVEVFRRSQVAKVLAVARKYCSAMLPLQWLLIGYVIFHYDLAACLDEADKDLNSPSTSHDIHRISTARNDLASSLAKPAETSTRETGYGLAWHSIFGKTYG